MAPNIWKSFRPFPVVCFFLLVIIYPMSAEASLYVTEDHIVLINASDSINRTVVDFRVLAEPWVPTLRPNITTTFCWVEHVALNKAEDATQLHYTYEPEENKPENWFAVTKIDNLKNIDELIFSLSSKVDLSESLIFNDLERLKVIINCSTTDKKLKGQFAIQILLYKMHETHHQLQCAESKVFHVAENVVGTSLGQICCELRDEKYISSLSTDSDESYDSHQMEESFFNSNSSSEEQLVGGLECYLKAVDNQTQKDYSYHFVVAFGLLNLVKPLDYEQIKELDLTFECVRGFSSISKETFQAEEGTIVEMVESVRICKSKVVVINQDDIGPWIIRNRNQTLKYFEVQSYFNNEEIKKGQMIHYCLSFSDADATNPKAYQVQVIGDRYNIIQAVVNHDRNVGHLRCVDLMAKRDFDLKHISSGVITFTVRIIDTLFVPTPGTNDTNKVEYKIRLSTRGAQTINVTFESVEIFHLTAPYHRVSSIRYRPILGTTFHLKMENCNVIQYAESTLLRQKTLQLRRQQNETNKSKQQDGKGNDCKIFSDLFKITPKEGIVFINNIYAFDKISSASLNILVEKKMDGRKFLEKNRDKNFDPLVSNITVTIINSTRSSTKPKSYRDSFPKELSCSWNNNQQSCKKNNGIGTLKGQCIWIIPQLKNISEDGNVTNEVDENTNEGIGGQMKNVVSNYETCSSSPATCPDLVCDELEKMYSSLCPQDCTPFEVHGIGNLKPAPNAGIDTISGTRCWCDKKQHCSCDNINPIKKIFMDVTTPCHGPHCLVNQTYTQDESDSDSICGNTCRFTIVSSVAVVFFLLSGALIVTFLLYRNGKFSFKSLLKDGSNNSTMNGKPSKVARISGTLVENPQYAEEPLLEEIGNSHLLWNKIYFSSNFKFSKWEIDRSSLKLESVIGEGEFGKVLRARAKNVPGYPKEMIVAVKTLKDCASASEYRDLISEFNLLQQVEHANIVKLIGICSSPEGPLYVVVEFCKHGSLKSYLKKFRINWQHQESIETPVLNAQSAPTNADETLKKPAQIKQNEFSPEKLRCDFNPSLFGHSGRKNEKIGNISDVQNSGKEFEYPKRHPTLMSDCTMNLIKYTTHPHSKSKADKTKQTIFETLNIAISCPTLQSQTGLWYRRLSAEQINQSNPIEINNPDPSDNKNNLQLVELSSDDDQVNNKNGYEEKKNSKSDEESLEFIGERDLLSFCWQIAKGMEYLGSMRIVHRDLAARNILVAEGRIAKISDFGLSRDVYEGDAYLKTSKGPLPVKWMAPESLFDHIFTHKSDVWSYGVIMWEIVTMGANPYPGITAENLFTLLKSGYRMEKPVSCSSEIFEVMQSCWQNDPKKRPSFKSLVKQFEKFLSKKSNYLDLSRMTKENDAQFSPPDVVKNTD